MNVQIPTSTVASLAALLVLGGCERSVDTEPTAVSTESAMHHGMTVEDLSDLDLSYTPPLSSPWDPVQMAAQAWVKAWRAAERGT